ncbi:MAG: glycosyltransferase family 4 protein [Armatimonadetes bacterium]|nr:glycosyltransferase family 4 protein [Armatimonadota bacterium]MDE2206484.1 glycosyltransferase family 4 protein [Armatimonadota bacterium]
MNVAVDGRAITGRYTGDRTYWRNLIRAMLSAPDPPKLTVYTRIPVDAAEAAWLGQAEFISLPAANDRVWSLLVLPRAIQAKPPDVLHVQYNVPPRIPCPVVTTVHDVSFRLYPQWYRPYDRLLLNMFAAASMRRAARVITVSESSRRDILRLYDLDPGLVIATPLGLPEEFLNPRDKFAESLSQVRATYGLDAPFVFSVGVLQPRKNLAFLAEAFAVARQSAAGGMDLVIAGKPGWGGSAEEIVDRARSANNGADPAWLRLLGYVPDGDLPALYAASLFYCHPAMYEGFGLPPLEAMACGTPVLVSDRPAMPEVVGDAALIAPLEQQQFQSALVRMMTDPALRESLAALGPPRAARFTWRSTAARTIQAYKDVTAS